MCLPSDALVATPVHASRVPIFAPTVRASKVEAWRAETSWGWAIVTGRLGQRHRDLVDAARFVAEREEWTADGRFHLLVNPAKLRAALGGDSTNYQRIREWLDNLMTARVQLRIEKRDINIMGGIVDTVVDSPVATPETRPGAFRAGRRYWRISFNEAWATLVREDLAMKYPVLAVIRLGHGFSKAVARYCLGHARVHEGIAGLMQRLAAEGRLRDRRRELLEDAGALAALGISLEGDQVLFVHADSDREQSPGHATRSATRVPANRPKREQSPGAEGFPSVICS